jgi:hypothetical protein
MSTVSHIAAQDIRAEEFEPSDGKLLRHSPARRGAWTRIATLWRAALGCIAPLGYEDEMGFHYGEMPAQDSAAR